MTYDDLYNSFHNLTNKCIDLLSPQLKYFIDSNNRYVEAMSETSRRYRSNTDLIEEYQFAKNYVRRLITNIDQSLKNEFEECSKVIQNDDKISMQLQQGGIILDSVINHLTPIIFILHILQIMITDYLVTKKLNQHKLRSLCNDITKFFYDNKLEIITVSPLRDFECHNLDSIVLSEILTIRKISLVEKINLLSKKISNEIFPFETKWIIEYKTMIEKDLENDPRVDLNDSNIKDSTFAATITALRLYQFGNFGTDSYIKFIPLDIPVFLAGLSNLKIMGFDSSSFGSYIFDHRKENDFKEFWKKYSPVLIKVLDFRIEENDPLIQIKNALNRFNLSYQREEGTDIIIDKVIAIESLLSKPGDPTDSLAYRIAIRASKLLRTNTEERIQAFKVVRDIYDIRSKIVHGSIEEFHYVKDKKIKKYTLDIIHHTISEIITKYLDLIISNNDFSHRRIIEKLDFD